MVVFPLLDVDHPQEFALRLALGPESAPVRTRCGGGTAS